MCGFAGYVKIGGDDVHTARNILAAMTTAIRHRGPDDSGAWIDGTVGVALGHRRLSVLDLSAQGSQPMLSPDGRLVLVYNGEIYNFPQLRNELAGQGRIFRGHSDTEVLLAAIERWGVHGALARCNGMFAFALWDRGQRRLYLARDRVGEKPLYYGWFGQTLLFGSELKALRCHPAFDSTVDRGALALFLRYGYVPSPHSIYRSVRKLPPGTLLTLERLEPGSERLDTYWSAREVVDQATANRFQGSPTEAVDRLETLLTDAVGIRMVADVPLGAFLSGGIDSSTIVALMQAQSTQPVHTFSIGFHEEKFNEAVYARAVAEHLGTDHTELYVTPQDSLDVIPLLPTLWDEPFSDPSQIPTYLVSRLARRHVTVSLSGDGGDELFGGYSRYFRVQRRWKRLRQLPAPARRLAGRGLTTISEHTWDGLLASLGPVLPARLRNERGGEAVHKLGRALTAEAPEELYRGLLSHWRDPLEVTLGASEPETALTDNGTWLALDSIAERMMFLDLVTYLPDDILVKVDRASMGVSLESRIPLLDPRVIEFAWSLPLEMKMRGATGKWALRQVLDRHVPRALIDRPKMGFGVPIDLWLKADLRDWAEDLLDESALRRDGLLDPVPIRRKWSQHQAGSRNWEYCLWDVLMFQAWSRTESPANGDVDPFSEHSVTVAS